MSTEKEEQEHSPEAQTDYFENYIKENPRWKFVELYVDNGISGLSYHNREGFTRMVADAVDGKIDLIITKSLSRFARNTVDALMTIRKLKAEGVGVFFRKEDINTLDSKGEFMLTLMSSFAEEGSCVNFYNDFSGRPRSHCSLFTVVLAKKSVWKSDFCLALFIICGIFIHLSVTIVVYNIKIH